MKGITNASSFEWIQTGRQAHPPSYSPSGVPLACIMPLQFERYAKILHRLTVSEDKVDPSLSDKEHAILKIADCNSVKHLVAPKPMGTRILWREAAQALGVAYSEGITHSWFSRALGPNPECWPRFIDGPADGALDLDECRELSTILVRSTAGHECLCRLPEIPFIGTDQSLLFEGLLEDVPDFFANYQFGPEYWWPQDQQWCVCSDYDLTFTIVGGASQLISALLKSDALECIEISPMIRVDDLTSPPSDSYSADE